MSFVVPAPSPISVPVLDSADRFPVRRIYCVGRNYVEHAKEMGFTGREPPFFFLKPADAIVHVAPGETGSLPYPPGTQDLHHEVELVVAIGKGGADILAANAREHVFGYAIGLDMTRRDLQAQAKKQGRPWEIGKGFDHSAPIGTLVPLTRTGWLDNGRIELKVNGAVRQSSTLDKLIWNVAETIEYLSNYWQLEPGDLIYSGTPEGVAAVVKGDVLEATFDGVPPLRIRID